MFDDALILKDGSVALDENDVAAILLTINSDGNYAVDISKTSNAGLYAVMICPSAPTTYADTLTATIQHSHHFTDGWENVAAFPVLKALVRYVEVTATTAFLSSDIGLVLTATTDSASDGGIILDFDKALLTVGGKGTMLVQMSDANDDYSTAGDIVTATAGTGVGTITAAGVLTKQRSYGMYVVRFATERQYVRSQTTVSAGGSWGLTEIYLTNSPPKVYQF